MLIRLLLSFFEWGKGQIFVCTECGNEFYESNIKVVISGFKITGGGINDRNKRILKCPSCGRKRICVMKDHRV